MLTKLGKYAIFFGNKVAMSPDSGVALCPFKLPNGSDGYWGMSIYTGFGNASAHKLIFTDVTTGMSGNQVDGIALGSGSTPPSDSDYTVENQILSLTGSPYSTTPSYSIDEDGNVVCELQFTLNNPGNEDVVVREICKFSTGYYNATKGGNGAQYRGLVDRTVLETPLTVPAGESAVLRYQFKYPPIA